MQISLKQSFLLSSQYRICMVSSGRSNVICIIEELSLLQYHKRMVATNGKEFVYVLCALRCPCCYYISEQLSINATIGLKAVSQWP